MTLPPTIPALPQIMVAPNGAYKTKQDHPALPVSNDEIVATALACFRAGADGIHAHIRDQKGQHSLDRHCYGDLLAQLQAKSPEKFVQITTETAGRYSAQDQRDLVYDLKPPAISVALREQWPEAGALTKASDFTHWAFAEGISVQHILYMPAEVERLAQLIIAGRIPVKPLQILLVVGRDASVQKSPIARVQDYLDRMAALPAIKDAEWAVCAFGQAETDCLAYAHARGGRVRVGFENSLYHSDGTMAADNAARVVEVIKHIEDNTDISVR